MLLSAEHLTIDFGSRRLLDDVNFYLNEGDKTGIIGINGTGKSTFLKILAGGLEPDAGTVARNPNVQVSVLPQNPVMEDGATVLEQVFLHFPSEFRALNEYEAKSMLNRLGLPDYIIQKAADRIDAENVRFEDVLSQLDLQRQAMEKEKEQAAKLRREMEEARAQAEQYRQRIEEERRKATEKAQAEARAIIEQARDAADETFKELNEMRRRQEQAREWVDDNEQRAQLRRKLNEADAALGGRKEDLPPPPPTRDAVIGDTVELTKMGTQAEVVGVNKDGTLQLQAGILKLKAKQSEVRVLEDVTARKKQSAKDKQRAASVSRPFRAAAAKAELDLRGMMVDEALGAVDLFLDNALMGKLETVTIIHGKGTGALRKAVRDHLKKSRYVKEYRPGVYGEGEDGVTVATLK